MFTVGFEAQNRSSSAPLGGSTYISRHANAACTGKGIIHTIGIFCARYSTVYDTVIGIFYGSNLTWTCRSWVNLGAVSGNDNSYKEFGGLSLTCEVGDRIGIYASHTIDRGSLTAGACYLAGNQMAIGQQTYINYSSCLSLQGWGDAVSVGGGGILIGSILNSDILRGRILRG